jgi:hypothetical protein
MSPPTGEMSVMDREKGDLKVIWDKDNRDEVAAAKAQFEDLTKKGFVAYEVKGKEGRKGNQIRQFDPSAERIILAPALRGG